MRAFPKTGYESLDRILNDRHLRALTAAALSCGWNLLYALFNLGTAYFSRSWWFLTMGVYYALLGLLRASALSFGHAGRRTRTGASMLRHSGIVLCGLSIVFVGIVCLTINEKRNTDQGKILTIALAAFTFTMTGFAIRNMVLARRSKEPRLILLRNISLSGAVVSMFSLERSMLGSFSKGDPLFSFRMEGASGLGAFLIILTLGIGLILEGRKSTENGKKDDTTS